MAGNVLYPTFKERLLNKELDLDTDSIKASLVDGADYTYNAADNEYSGASRDVPLAGIVAESAALGSPTIAVGVFDTADFTWTTVSGDQSEIVLLWDDVPANDPLIAYYDTGITGMPVTPNGGNINVTVNGSGWFAL